MSKRRRPSTPKKLSKQVEDFATNAWTWTTGAAASLVIALGMGATANRPVNENPPVIDAAARATLIAHIEGQDTADKAARAKQEFDRATLANMQANIGRSAGDTAPALAAIQAEYTRLQQVDGVLQDAIPHYIHDILLTANFSEDRAAWYSEQRFSDGRAFADEIAYRDECIVDLNLTANRLDVAHASAENPDLVSVRNLRNCMTERNEAEFGQAFSNFSGTLGGGLGLMAIFTLGAMGARRADDQLEKKKLKRDVQDLSDALKPKGK